MLKYKIDVLAALKTAGYSTYRIQREHIFGSSDIQGMKHGVICSKNNLNKLCMLLECQPGDIIEYVPDQ